MYQISQSRQKFSNNSPKNILFPKCFEINQVKYMQLAFSFITASQNSKNQQRLLKELSSKMDPAEISLIRYVFIKERGFQKNPPIPYPVRAL